VLGTIRNMSITDTLQGMRVAFLATDGVDAAEYSEPRAAVEAAGGQAELVSLRPGSVQAVSGMDKTGTFPVDHAVGEVDPGNFAGLVLPGGVWNSDQLRMDPRAVAFVRAFFDQGKPVGAICHGPWVLIEAGVVEGMTMTSYPSLRTDLVNAGAFWVDEENRVDQGLVTSRRHSDLPAFCAAIVEELAQSQALASRG
jgi:protease I